MTDISPSIVCSLRSVHTEPKWKQFIYCPITITGRYSANREEKKDDQRNFPLYENIP